MDILVAVIATLSVVLAAGGAAYVLVQRRDRAEVGELRAMLGEARNAQQQLADQMLASAAARLDDRLHANDRELDLRQAAIDDSLRSTSTAVNRQIEELRSQLGQVSTSIQQLNEERARQHGEFVTRLEQTVESQQVLARTAEGLRDALANPRARGSWGERTADDLLRQLGFVEGISYRRQSQTAAGTKPDFTFLLPGGRELNMDVKFPADNYLRYLEATNEVERATHRRQFLADVKQRMKELGGREYVDPERTVDYLLLFIPNESIYSFIHEHQRDLVDQALARKIILCSPFTLFGVLAVVRQAVELFRLEQRGDEIHRCLQEFSKQWERFSGAIEDVEKKLGTLNRAVGDLAGTRRNQLQRQIDRIERLEPPEPAAEGDPLALVTGDEVGTRDVG